MPVSDDLPPPQDGGVRDEGHRRAVVEAAAAPPPRLAAGIELIGEYEDSGFKEPPYIARRADGQVIQMAKLLYLVAEEVDGRRGYGEIGDRVSEKFGRGLDAEMAEMLVETKLRPLGVVAPADGSTPELQKLDPLLALKFRAAIVPERLVAAITRVFRPLFLPPVIVAVLGGLVALDVWLFGFHGIAQSLRQTLYDPLFILLMLGLVVLSAALHECGHATATAYGGAKPGVMGAGIYIVWPAFYTDITDAYRLGKGGRLRADLGGVYFNVIFILGTVAAYFATGFEPLLLLIPLQHLEILHQFLPFLRLDGYYIVSDLTGVPDMFMRIKPTLKSLLPWQETDEKVTELKPWVRAAVTAYVFTFVPLLLLFLALTVMNMPRIFATAYDSFLVTEHKLVHASALNAIVDGIQLAVLVLIPLGVVATVARFGLRAGKGAWSRTEGHPLARVALVCATAAAAGFAAYTWYPQSVYRPIQPGERGTLVGAADEFAQIPSGRPALTAQRAKQLGGAGFRSKSRSPTVPDKTHSKTHPQQTSTSPTSSTSTATTSTGATGATDTTTTPASTSTTAPTATTATATTATETTSTAATTTATATTAATVTTATTTTP